MGERGAPAVAAVLIAAGPVLAAHAGLLAVWDLASRPALTLTLLAAAGAGLVWAVRRLARQPGSKVAGILLVALLLRLLLLPVPTTLSDDLLRYVWDGQVVGAGANPYLLAPQDPALESLRGPLWRSLPHRDVPTVYPPLALGLFSIAAQLPAPLLTLKALLSACDLLTCLLLIRLAGALGLPRERAAWYAWNPLVVLETAGMGHVDALGVALVVATLLLLVRDPRRIWAPVATAAGAVLAKLIPIAAVPVWVRSSRRPARFAAALGLVALPGLLPMVAGAPGVPPGLTRFAIGWEFNGPLYEPLWRTSDRLDLQARVAAGLDAAKAAFGRHELWNRLYPYNYPQLHAKLLLAAALVAALVVIWRRRDPVAGTGAVFGAVIVFSATVYPWYLLWVLPVAALRQQRSWLLLSLLLPLSYLPQITEIRLLPWVFLAIWVPFFAALAVDWSRSRAAGSARGAGGTGRCSTG